MMKKIRWITFCILVIIGFVILSHFVRAGTKEEGDRIMANFPEGQGYYFYSDPNHFYFFFSENGKSFIRAFAFIEYDGMNLTLIRYWESDGQGGYLLTYELTPELPTSSS